MNTRTTDITVVLDRSGSMEAVRNDTIGGFNTFLKDQQGEPGKATFTLVQFDTVYEFVYTAVPIADVPLMTARTFVPRGGTALLDAIGRAVNETGKRLGDLPESDRPAHVLFVILTDGAENSSREFSRETVFAQIKHQQEKYNWQFIFLGANQDAISAAATMGIGGASSLTYASNAAGTAAAFSAVSGQVMRSRRGAKAEFTTADRAAQKAAGA